MSKQPQAPSKRNTLRRWREVRDIHNLLRKKYRKDVVIDFISTNYFMDERGIYTALTQVDKQPVVKPSLIYSTVYREDFKL
jgi:hypothetical protein